MRVETARQEPGDGDDDWDDICRLCGRAGELMCCDGEGCPHAYHPRCVGFAKPPVINGWLCPQCARTKRNPNEDPSQYKAFEHQAELLWVDSQLDRPVSERMLACDRRITGRNASLFQRFAAAARAPVQLPPPAAAAAGDGGEEKEDGSRRAGRRSEGGAAAASAARDTGVGRGSSSSSRRRGAVPRPRPRRMSEVSRNG
eukprot:COSAG01_NODE_16514_length_1230_cov_1.973475_1_plen_200_part_00